MELTSSIPVIQNLVYIFSSILFILGIKMLGKESTAVKGNFLSAIAMLLAVLVTTLSLDINLLTIMVAILIGASVGSLIALKVKMTAIPEMVALFNGFGGVGIEIVISHRFFNGFGGLLWRAGLSGSDPAQIQQTRRTPQGRIQGSFLPLEEPSSETLLGKKCKKYVTNRGRIRNWIKKLKRWCRFSGAPKCNSLNYLN